MDIPMDEDNDFGSLAPSTQSLSSSAPGASGASGAVPHSSPLAPSSSAAQNTTTRIRMDDEQQEPPHFHAPAPIISANPNRRTLGPHNSPVKSMSGSSSAHTSPRVTPTKGANPYGDRYIPLRRPDHDWNSRYHSINSGEQDGFKKPMGSCNRNLNMGGGGGGGGGNGSSGSMSSSSSSSSGNLVTFTGISTTASSAHHHAHNSSASQSHHDYYQGTASGSTTPTGTSSSQCLDDSGNGQAVVRALLRNEMLKDRIDDVKAQIAPTEGELSSFAMGPVVTAFQGSGTGGATIHVESTITSTTSTSGAAGGTATITTTTTTTTLPTPGTPGNGNGGGGGGQVVIAQLERNAYGGSVDSVFPVMDGVTGINGIGGLSGLSSINGLSGISGVQGINDSTRVHGAGSPTFADMMEPRLRGGADSPQDIPQSPVGSVCGDTPQKTPVLPLSPLPVKSSPARSLFAYSAKITPVKVFGNQSPTINGPFGGPLGIDSQRLLRTPRKATRKVPKNPYKVLDAPELQDDFYLNLVDWSSQNQLSVGLSSCVYLWSATTSQVIKLCDLSAHNDQDTVTSVQWCDKGDLLAVGTNRGITQIWDVTVQKKIRDLPGHTSRIGCLAWNADTICSGSRDRMILHRDIRCDDTDGRKLTNHRQEVCGLKWSPDKQLLASGGNDNQLLVWNLRRNEPIQTYNQHNAAVKALAWSPHHHGLLVSGGGTADRCLRFWNTLTAQPMQMVDTGSQVCNVAWSKHSSELVSTHGYSYNHVIIWKYPSLQPVTKLVGHQYRVLYLAMSPDGESIVTGAGDETLRFWHVFNKGNPPTITRSKLNLHSTIR